MKNRIKIDWREQRLNESGGFISKRIAHKILLMHSLLYGASYAIDYGMFGRIIHPENIVKKHGKILEIKQAAE